MLRALGRLLRLSLAPSALADVAAGAVLGAGAWPAGTGPWLALAGSACVYHGGMALNDWADRDEDRGTRPDRPLPSGRVAPGFALALALVLLAAAPLLGLGAGPRPGLLLGLIALLVVAYDLGPRGSWLAPALLGACRAANLSVGLALAAPSEPLAPATLAPALAYGLYVFFVSRLARLEDLPPQTELGDEPARRLRPAAVLLSALPLAALGAHPPLWALAAALCLTTAGAAGLFDRARAGASWSVAQVGPVVGLALRRLLVATAALALLAPPDGTWVCGLILLGYPLSFALRRVFPPT